MTQAGQGFLFADTSKNCADWLTPWGALARRTFPLSRIRSEFYNLIILTTNFSSSQVK
jgi:hypothetical protein